jgi:hypothetical protein
MMRGTRLAHGLPSSPVPTQLGPQLNLLYPSIRPIRPLLQIAHFPLRSLVGFTLSILPSETDR